MNRQELYSQRSKTTQNCSQPLAKADIAWDKYADWVYKACCRKHTSNPKTQVSPMQVAKPYTLCTFLSLSVMNWWQVFTSGTRSIHDSARSFENYSDTPTPILLHLYKGASSLVLYIFLYKLHSLTIIMSCWFTSNAMSVGLLNVISGPFIWVKPWLTTSISFSCCR